MGAQRGDELTHDCTLLVSKLAGAEKSGPIFL